ncbi:MAG: alpha-ketoglutarate-dependent dioxygenase AlkB [Rhodospirillaceae bacterium]|nr:alpha-ketoglutarate-dependent dioxygenase AlkB [Rhodospirillaceae bacterium]|tara:strand:- start:2461 stop:3036 length:576 start_codon:yes stop_codon:yes gene_type:complete
MIEKQKIAETNIFVYKRFYSSQETLEVMKGLREEIEWKEVKIKVFGKEYLSPRLSAWYGEKSYKYSGYKWDQKPWPQSVIRIKKNIEKLTLLKFNGVLANLYRSGQDSMGWHSDDEKELGSDPIIASIVFGSTRRFLLRDKNIKNRKKEIKFEDGDLMLMGNGVQKNWEHSIPKTAKNVGERVNLTFRLIY